MKIIKYILLLLLYVPLATATVSTGIEKKLPAFTGEWYIESSYSYQNTDNYYTKSYLNQCLLSEYEYQFTSKFQEELIKRYINTLPTYNCKWEISNKSESNNEPLTYPTADWDELLKQNTAKKKQQYFLQCIEKSGDYQTAHYETLYLSPIYQCPENTRAGYKNFGVYCLNETNLCNADIAGRALDGAGFLGHVGLTTNENEILEVLNKPIVIQKNSLEDFAKRTTFWGIVYGYKKQEKLTYMEATNILHEGEYQMEFDPKYIIFAYYREGGLKKKSFFDYFKQEKSIHIAKQQAIFRCDTFIQYSYLKGANIFISELVPVLLFKSFKHTREALPLLNNIYNFIFSVDLPKRTDCTSDECYKNLIDSLINQKASIDEIILTLDEYRAFLNNKEKFDSYVFKKYLETSKNTKLNNALLDFIIQLEPDDELIGNLIDMYSSNNLLPHIKSSIFRQFEYLFVYEPDENFEFGSKRVKNINRVNEIVINILQTSNNAPEGKRLMNDTLLGHNEVG